MFEICTSTPATHATCKVFDDSDALFPWTGSDGGCNRCLQVRNCLWIVSIDIVLQIAPKVEIWGFTEAWRVWSPPWVTPPTDEAIREMLLKPVQRVV